MRKALALTWASGDSAVCKKAFTTLCKKKGHMRQCPYHQDVYVRPGNQCQTCLEEQVADENKERVAKEQEWKAEKEEQVNKWLKEMPGRREDKPRKEKPGTERNPVPAAYVVGGHQGGAADLDPDPVSHRSTKTYHNKNTTNPNLPGRSRQPLGPPAPTTPTPRATFNQVQSSALPQNSSLLHLNNPTFSTPLLFVFGICPLSSPISTRLFGCL